MKLILPILLLSLSLNSHSQPLPEDSRKEFVRTGVRSCIEMQKKDKFSVYLKPEQIQEYCTCTLNKASKIISVEDLGLMLQTKQMDHLRPTMEQSSYQCIQFLTKKWGYAR